MKGSSSINLELRELHVMVFGTEDMIGDEMRSSLDMLKTFCLCHMLNQYLINR